VFKESISKLTVQISYFSLGEKIRNTLNSLKKCWLLLYIYPLIRQAVKYIQWTACLYMYKQFVHCFSPDHKFLSDFYETCKDGTLHPRFQGCWKWNFLCTNYILRHVWMLFYTKICIPSCKFWSYFPLENSKYIVRHKTSLFTQMPMIA
jgi:hypothetical protein